MLLKSVWAEHAPSVSGTLTRKTVAVSTSRLLKDCPELLSTDAFGALKNEGTVVCWGDEDYGGDCSEVQPQLMDVETIYATERAFAAVKKDRTVVCWGNKMHGGDCSAVQQQLVDVETIHATCAAFAAVLRNGSVVCWGDADFGGDCSKVQQQLEKVAVIEAAMTCFFATKADGSVVIWGGPACFQPSRATQRALKSGIS